MFTRYAVFYTLPDGPLERFSASWLGWDLARGSAVTHPKISGLDIARITETPRKYGIHGTIKPPFALADGTSEAGLADALEVLCKTLQTVTLAGLAVTQLGRFLALCPVGDTKPLNDLAATLVRDLDTFRAPLTADEITRRSNTNLTSTQVENLANWGYPHVMDAFRFHITLTDRLDKNLLPKVQETLGAVLAPLVPSPFVIDSLALVGQRADGMFEQIRRYPLAP